MEFETFDPEVWKIIEKMTFYKSTHSILIEFRSGNKLSATSPNQSHWDHFMLEATINLGNEKVHFE